MSGRDVYIIVLFALWIGLYSLSRSLSDTRYEKPMVCVFMIYNLYLLWRLIA